MKQPMTCPTNPTPYDDHPDEMMAGCGSEELVIDASENDGFVDCECGMWFNPVTEYGEDWRDRYYIKGGTINDDTA